MQAYRVSTSTTGGARSSTKKGEGGSTITVITVEQIAVIGPEGEILFEWP